MKKINLLCIGFILSFQVSASMITDPIVLQGIIQNGILNAGFIFEGEVISTKSYWNPEHNYIYTANQVRVINVWKNTQNEVTVFGEEQLVEVITHGGMVGDTSLSISHNIGFVPGQRGMFMCQSVVVPINPGSTTSLAFQFELFDGLYMDYNREDYIISATYGSIKFECVEELYELIDPTYISDCLGFYDDPNLLDQKYNDMIDVQQNMYQVAQSSAPFGKITYLMKNARSVQVGGAAKFIVEIWAQTDKQGMYLTSSNVELQFSELAFGSTPVGLNRVKVFKGGFLYGNYAGQPRYILPPAIDLPSSNSGYGVIGFGSHTNDDTKEPIEMLQYTPVQLFIVEIEIQNCNELPELIFTNTTNMRDLSGYVSKMPPNYPFKWSDYRNFAQIDASDDVNDPMCETSILSITPTKVNAGNADIIGIDTLPQVINDDIVTINGHFFGSQKGTIKMRNTDHLDTTLIWVSLDTDYDIISWSDNQIKFRVPSTIPVTYTNSQVGLLKVPGAVKSK